MISDQRFTALSETNDHLPIFCTDANSHKLMQYHACISVKICISIYIYIYIYICICGRCRQDKPEDCPLKGHCTGVQCVVYKATISAPNHAEKYYYGLSEPEFKSRYANHKSSLKYPSKRNTTELSKYYWELRDKGVDKKDIKVDWRIERQAHKYKCGTRRCDLCLTEKLVIALADKSTMLNKRSEIISACPHRTKYRYHKVTKVKMK